MGGKLGVGGWLGKVCLQLDMTKLLALLQIEILAEGLVYLASSQST